MKRRLRTHTYTCKCVYTRVYMHETRHIHISQSSAIHRKRFNESADFFHCSIHAQADWSYWIHKVAFFFRCKIPGVENDSYSFTPANVSLDYWIPKDPDTREYNSCLIYDHSSTNYSTSSYNSSSQPLLALKCTQYVFDREAHWGKTMTEEVKLFSNSCKTVV